MANLLSGTRIYGNATIDSNLVINGGYAATSTTTGSLQLLGGAGITGNLYVGGNLSSVSTASTSASNNFSMYSTTAAAYRFYVDWGGTIHATSASITAISDRSLKTNIRPLETGLVEIIKLQPRRFDWINGDASNVAGFIAQEVEEVLPELVTDQMYSESETKKALKMGDILPTLVSAIQQQQAIIASLTDRIAILEAK
jgi:hypothetical protein